MTTPNTDMPAEDLTEAYNLHPSDHPGLMLVSTNFDGNGFGSWKRAMAIALSNKSKLYFVDGSLTKPQFLNVLAKNIVDSITFAKTARQMWTELEERFGQVNGAKLYHAKKELCTVSQGTDDIASYFTKVKSLWDELDDLDEIPSCTCSSA